MSVKRSQAADTRKRCYSCEENVSNISNVSNRCKGCACDQLSELKINDVVDLYLFSGTVFINAAFNSLDRVDCCAYFTYTGRTLVVNCKDIEAILLP